MKKAKPLCQLIDAMGRGLPQPSITVGSKVKSKRNPLYEGTVVNFLSEWVITVTSRTGCEEIAPLEWFELTE